MSEGSDTSMIGIGIYVLLLITLAVFSGANPISIIIGTLPILLTIGGLFYLRGAPDFLPWLLPLLFPVIFFFLWNTGSVELLNQLDGYPLLIFNIVFSYIIAFIMANMSSIHKHMTYHEPQPLIHEQQPIHQQVQPEVKHIHHDNSKLYEEQMKKQRELALEKNRMMQQKHQQQSKKYEDHIMNLRMKLEKTKAELQITKENFNIKLRSIEDKCKGINFVIGRVYAEKKGGSVKIRQKLNINRDLYNKFSEISANFDDKYAVHLLTVLEKIYHQILLLEQQENTLFSLNSAPQLPVKRDQNGLDRVIDVLTNNDKDPVKEYHAEAKEVCIKLINFLKKEYAKT